MKIVGNVKFKISGSSVSKLLNKLLDSRIKCQNIIISNDTITGQTSITEWNSIILLCDELDMDIESVNKSGFVLKLNWLWHRKGIIVGFILGLIMIMLLSNILLRIRVKGGNDDVNQKLLNYIQYKNISYGQFLPDIDTFSLELEMLQEFNEIAWVGIYRTGGTLNIDVVEADEKPPFSQRRLPSDLIASHEGKIVKVQVYGGQLLTPVGSGVHKGQVLVSGEVEFSETQSKLYRSTGSIYAEYTETVPFYCPFEDIRKVETKNNEDRYYLNFFELDLPLSFAKKEKGQYETKEKSIKLSFLGIEIPLSFKKVEHIPYDFKITNYNEQEATSEVYRLSQNYEKNLLSDCEIIDKKEVINKSLEGIELEVTYTVVKDIAVEKEILIK